MKKIFASIVLMLALLPAAFAQHANTFYADQFPGNDVGTKVTLAQSQCLVDATVPCVIIIDTILAKFSTGNMPTRCANCTWVDWRNIGASFNPVILSPLSGLTINTTPDGLSIANPFQSIGNSATPAAMGFPWSTMGFFSGILPAGSSLPEFDGVFGFAEGLSVPTAIVGVRGQGQAGANNVTEWGGNVLCTDYNHVGTIFTGTRCTGFEIDSNIRSTTTVGAGLTLVTNGPATPAGAYPAISINGNSVPGSQYQAGIIVNNGSIASGQGLFLGSRGFTGVVNQPSFFMELDGANSGGVAVAAFMQASKDGDILFNALNRGIGINLGGGLLTPTEPVGALDVNGTTRATAYTLNGTSVVTSPGLWMQANLPTLTGGTSGIQFNNAANSIATMAISNTGAVSAPVSFTAPTHGLTANITWTSGAGVPSAGTCNAANGGSFYSRTDGTTTTTLYVCDNSTHVWTPK